MVQVSADAGACDAEPTAQMDGDGTDTPGTEAGSDGPLAGQDGSADVGGDSEDAALRGDGPLAAQDASSDVGGNAVDVGPPVPPFRSQKLVCDTWRNFGGEVAVSGNTIAIASEGSNRVCFLDRTESGWTQSAVLDLPAVNGLSSGCTSLAMDGDLAVVGASQVSRPSWAHVLRRRAGVWTVDARIDDPSADSQAQFGYAVAVSGDTVVVGAKHNYDGKPGSASVFVQGLSGWEAQATLASSADGRTATDLADDQFGRSVAISADTVAVARPGTAYRGVLVFRRENGTWQLDSAFRPDDALFRQPLSVALDGNRLLVGDNANKLGYLFEGDGALGWTSDATLTAQPDYNLGYSVALTARLAVLGGPARERSGYGNAYAFVRSQGSWSGPIALLPQGEPPPAGFGVPVAASGTTIVVGAPFATQNGVEVGAAFAFDLDLSAVP